jgi:hypothetical protein
MDLAQKKFQEGYIFFIWIYLKKKFFLIKFRLS